MRVMTFKVIKQYPRGLSLIGIFFDGIDGPMTTFMLSDAVWAWFKEHPVFEFNQGEEING